MDLAGLREFVRTYLDLDNEDLPDLILDSFLDDAASRIIRRDNRWPFLQKTWTFTATNGVPAYNLANIASDIREVESIQIDGYTLLWSGQADAEAEFNSGIVATSGTPYRWSVWADQLYLWPTPGADATVTLRGIRVPTSFVGGSAAQVPDLPTEFHSLIARYALACAYEQQDDPEMATLNKQHFEDELTTKWHAYKQVPSPTPLVLNGRANSPVVGGRFRFPFE